VVSSGHDNESRRRFLARTAAAVAGAASVGSGRAASAAKKPAASAARGRPLVVDGHGHISQLEVQDVEQAIDPTWRYDKNWKYGMSHRDNLQLMDAVGVDVQVLHCSRYLHAYHRRVMREHPGRFVALTKIDERLLPGDQGLELIRKHVEEWGFKGWYYDPWPPENRAKLGFDPKDWGTPDPFFHFDHPRYDPQWQLVQSLGVPVCVVSYAETFQTLGPALLNVVKRFPDLRVVVVHGLHPSSCLGSDGKARIPDVVVELLRHHPVVMELLTGLDGLRGRPNRYGPHDEVIRAFYDAFGPKKLMWGTEFTYIDLPTVAQYRYQFDYLKTRCAYMSAADLARIRGGTAVEVFRIEA
jgi:predicted TIM-barrel fold metal-dependent hydrolase